jgi:hypothetical protein
MIQRQSHLTISHLTLTAPFDSLQLLSLCRLDVVDQHREDVLDQKKDVVDHHREDVVHQHCEDVEDQKKDVVDHHREDVVDQHCEDVVDQHRYQSSRSKEEAPGFAISTFSMPRLDDNVQAMWSHGIRSACGRRLADSTGTEGGMHFSVHVQLD